MKKSEIAGLALIGALFVVWPVPRTISIRDLLLVVSCIFFGGLLWRQRAVTDWPRREAAPVWLYLALTIWLFVVALFVSDETAWSLNEIRGQWLKGTLALLAGVLAAARCGRAAAPEVRTLVVIYAALMLHVLYVDWLAVKPAIQFGQEITRRVIGFTEGSDKSNYLTNLLLLLLLTELFIRLVHRRRFLPLGNILLGASLLAALFSVYAESMRNGVIELSLVLLLFVSLLVWENRRRLGKAGSASVIAALLLMPAVFAYLSYRTDPRWHTFLETIPLALDTETHRQWINEGRFVADPPRLPGGAPVEWSNYMRIARMKAGAELVVDHPLGVGFGRNAFAHAVKNKYGMDSAHSHSGLVDLAVGTGVPGALLWLGFLACLLRLGWRGYRAGRNYAGLALVLLVAGYGIRMVLDSIVRDHMLQMFLFLAGLLAVMAARPGSEQDGRPAAGLS